MDDATVVMTCPLPPRPARLAPALAAATGTLLAAAVLTAGQPLKRLQLLDCCLLDGYRGLFVLPLLPKLQHLTISNLCWHVEAANHAGPTPAYWDGCAGRWLVQL